MESLLFWSDNKIIRTLNGHDFASDICSGRSVYEKIAHNVIKAMEVSIGLLPIEQEQYIGDFWNLSLLQKQFTAHDVEKFKNLSTFVDLHGHAALLSNFICRLSCTVYWALYNLEFLISKVRGQLDGTATVSKASTTVLLKEVEPIFEIMLKLQTELPVLQSLLTTSFLELKIGEKQREVKDVKECKFKFEAVLKEAAQTVLPYSDLSMLDNKFGVFTQSGEALEVALEKPSANQREPEIYREIRLQLINAAGFLQQTCKDMRQDMCKVADGSEEVVQKLREIHAKKDEKPKEELSSTPKAETVIGDHHPESQQNAVAHPHFLCGSYVGPFSHI